MGVIGEQIKKYRTQKKYTQEKLGSLIGVTTQAVSKWERGGTPDAEVLPILADALGVSIDALYGREDRSLQLLLTQKLSKLPPYEAFHAAFEICWAMILGLVGDDDYAEDFIDTFSAHSYTNRENSPDYFAKMVRDNGLAMARLSADFNQFYMLAEPNEGSTPDHLEDMEAIRRVFALFADENILKIIFYLYSRPFMPLTLSLISQSTGLDTRETERCMRVICENRLANHMTIAGVDGVIESYEICREGCVVPLICFADEIAKKSPFPIFSVLDRKEPLFKPSVYSRSV